MEASSASSTNITFDYVNQNEQTEHAATLEDRFAATLPITGTRSFQSFTPISDKKFL